MKNNSELISDTELTVVIDPSCYTHTMSDGSLAFLKNSQFKQAYFENPNNKCILIRGIKDEYKRTEDNKITLECENRYGPLECCYNSDPNYEMKHCELKEHTYEQIKKIITSQTKVLGINTNEITKITIFDISHANKDTKKFFAGFIQEKVDTLKVLNSLCPNCKHTKIASTACWGAIKDENNKNLINEILTSINKNDDWKKQNIVEIDITPFNASCHKIKIGDDKKPHVSYKLYEKMYKDKKTTIPTNFTRTIYLLTKNQQPTIIKQTHNFQQTSPQQKDPYIVTEGEGGFQVLSIDEIQKYTKQLENNEQQQKLSIKKINLKPICNENNNKKNNPQISKNNNVKQIIPNKIYQPLRPIIRPIIRPTIQNNFILQPRQQIIPRKNHLQPIQSRYRLQKKPIINKNDNMKPLKLSRNNNKSPIKFK